MAPMTASASRSPVRRRWDRRGKPLSPSFSTTPVRAPTRRVAAATGRPARPSQPAGAATRAGAGGPGPGGADGARQALRAHGEAGWDGAGGRGPVYIKQALAGQDVALQVDAAARTFVVYHRQQAIKQVAITGLYGEPLAFADYLALLRQEARLPIENLVRSDSAANLGTTARLPWLTAEPPIQGVPTPPPHPGSSKGTCSSPATRCVAASPRRSYRAVVVT
jgi:hypothetical protein